MGTSTSDTSLLKLEYGYGTTANNGNVTSQTITVPGMTYPLIQSYTYDELNRLASSTETSNLTQTWTQVFGYDRYGNRNITSGTGQTSLTFGSTNNRITTSGYSYDSAGNTIADPSGKTFTYDAENKQTAVNNGSIGQYWYDGDGKRVKKTTSTSDNVIFVYDAAGKLIEERNSSTGALQTSYIYAGSRLLSTETASATNYLTADHLGSPRINTDQNGAVTARHDYHPFGEEIDGSGGRTTGLGYQSDAVRKQFTGYERDNETGLDFAQARFFGAALGRFTSVDSGAFTPADPQNWNRYPIVQNNPLKFVDPEGTDLVLTGEEADYIVSELSKSTGLKLHRCSEVNDKKGCTKIGLVLITGIIEKQTAKKSGQLASKLFEIVGDPKHTVSIDTGRNQPRIFNDSFDSRAIDVADYDKAKSVAPEFATRLLAHVLEEYYQAETTFSKENASDRYLKSHDKGLEFESEVLSDLTGRSEQKRSNVISSDGKNVKYIYTLVEYDVRRKTGVGTDKSISNIEKITRRNLP